MFHTSACVDPIFLTLHVEETALSPAIDFSLLVKDQLHVNAWLYFCRMLSLFTGTSPPHALAHLSLPGHCPSIAPDNTNPFPTTQFLPWSLLEA